MKEIEINTTNLQRITVIDALRGFALLGVILMHMIDRFGYEITNLSNSSPSTLDTYVHWFSNLVIRGKFISIFSFLFGLSFFIQMERASKKGIDFRSRFLWRMLLLCIIGLIVTSFTYLDILSIYALFGVILVFLFPLKNWMLMLIVSLLLIGVPGVLLIGVENIKTESVIVHSSVSEQPETVFMPETLPNNEPALSNLNYFQTAKENLTVKTINKLKFQFLHSETGYLVLALFILGFVCRATSFFLNRYTFGKKGILFCFSHLRWLPWCLYSQPE